VLVDIGGITRRLVTATAILTLGVGCASGHGSATASTESPRPAVRSLSEADNGTTVTVHPGDLITVILHSTYWAAGAPSSAAVESQGSPVVAPDLKGCVPGGGCGTVTATYKAASDGAAQLTAHRDSCGEALACSADQRDWRVDVRVAG
jgi:hypothetical protein